MRSEPGNLSATASLESLSPSELERLAGVPSTAPTILEPRHIEAVLGINRTQRRHLEATGKLVPMERGAYEHARYLTVDVARAVLRYRLRVYWHRLGDA